MFDLQATIDKGNRKENAQAVIEWVGPDAARFAQVVSVFLKAEKSALQLSAWVIGMIGEPRLLIPHIDALVARMATPGIHPAAKRNVVRALQYIDLPESVHGAVMNICFDLLADPAETIAVRCFSMTVLGNLTKYYPEIKPELRIIIEDALQQEPSAGFKNRGEKLLASLQ